MFIFSYVRLYRYFNKKSLKLLKNTNFTWIIPCGFENYSKYQKLFSTNTFVKINVFSFTLDMVTENLHFGEILCYFCQIVLKLQAVHFIKCFKILIVFFHFSSFSGRYYFLQKTIFFQYFFSNSEILDKHKRIKAHKNAKNDLHIEGRYETFWNRKKTMSRKIARTVDFFVFTYFRNGCVLIEEMMKNH